MPSQPPAPKSARTLAVQSSEHDARSFPEASHRTVFTSFWWRGAGRALVSNSRLTRDGTRLAPQNWPSTSHLLTPWPWNVFNGAFSPTLQTQILRSVEHEANVLSSNQSTSNAGAAVMGARQTTAQGHTLPPRQPTPFTRHKTHTIMDDKFLFDGSGGNVPHDRRVVSAAAQQVVARLVELQ